jgi:hypothetical protein
MAPGEVGDEKSISYLEIIILGYKDQQEGWRPSRIKQLLGKCPYSAPFV